jgi:hypothetical protein
MNVHLTTFLPPFIYGSYEKLRSTPEITSKLPIGFIPLSEKSHRILKTLIRYREALRQGRGV